MPSTASRSPVLSRTLLTSLLGCVRGTTLGPVVNATSCRLFTAGPTPITPDSVPADFTEATFDGYAPVSVTPFTTRVITPNGEAMALTQNCLFTCTGIATPETILGYWVDDGAVVVCSEYFAVPLQMVSIGAYIDLLVLCPIVFIPETGA